ncbi:hypothetical protein QBC37DRAFT_425023 [Rhypophila decipiens]|uniref:Prolyl 4-hydroxylase alpha subunit domain-containing protein n=1 Tax=Rhypophila decipiens TaxID=261697 RepID=A0AAN7B6S4_9PEZI|nr:hypothetical protein QBC37DRAFT_425023 [Rhypophila decipiens]
MFSYLVPLLAVALFFYSPIVEILTGRSAPPKQIRRTPLPPINKDLLALEATNRSTGPSSCGTDSYSIHVFSREPLVIYIENFISLEERTHLLEISDPIFEPSTVTHDGGDSTLRDTTVRDSEVAVIPRTDVVRCIEDRARAFQGWRDKVWIERLRVQRYHAGGHYNHHFDWSSSRGGWGRVSSFMAWVDDDEGQLQGGGTEFPLLRPRPDPRWCSFVECRNATEASEQHAGGVVFRPLAGNAVYWENFRSDNTGRGYDQTWHAGLPVENGVKVGLNIWSWGRIE